MDVYRVRWSSTASLPTRATATVLGPVAVTLLAYPEKHPPLAIVSVLYLLAVVIAARIGGASAGIGASFLSFLCLNFFFTPPFHTFVVGTPADVVVLIAFLLVSVVVGLLLSSALSAKALAQQREREAQLLNRLATRLLSGEATEAVLTAFAEGLCNLFDLARCDIATGFTGSIEVRRRPTEQAPDQLPLEAHGRTLGEIVIWTDHRPLGEDEHRAIHSLATQLALALESMRLSVEVRRAEFEAHTNELKAALFAGVTHDVKTPLAAIMTSITSLIDGSDFSESQWQDHLETIKQEAERLHRVVNNLLDVARMRAGALQPSKSPSAIDEVMESVIGRLRPLLADREVEMRIAEDLPEVPVDVVQIDQVLTNLVENVVKFTPAGSPISLAAVGNDRAVRVSVSDRGPGIAKEDRSRIFEPFERGAGTGTGTGLGLAIAEAVIAAHGGRMWISDNPAGGATFTFELPARTSVDIPEEVGDAGARAGR